MQLAHLAFAVIALCSNNNLFHWQVLFLEKGRVDQFYDAHYQLAAFASSKPGHPYQVFF